MDFSKTAAGDGQEAQGALNPAGTMQQPPVGEAGDKKPALTARQEKDEDLSRPYTYKRTVSIALIKNYSLYRKANDKVLSKRRDYIGSSVRSSQILSSNRSEIEAYFPQLLGVSPNNDSFITRLNQYLNNIQVHVDELGVTFDCSFQYRHKKDYLAYKAAAEQIEEDYRRANRQDLQELKKALNIKIMALNNLESEQHAFGSPVNISDYILYRHCLLYRDIAKDTAVINSDPYVRFYFKDDAKEKEYQLKLRQEINNAKRNYVSVLGDEDLFDAVYVQYCVLVGLPIVSALREERILKEDKLDKFSMSEPAKFNKIVSDRDIELKSLIELLISRGEFVRSKFNQNITTETGEFIGANMKEAVTWAKNPENENVLAAFRNKLKHI